MFSQFNQSALNKPQSNFSAFNIADPAGQCCGVTTQQSQRASTTIHGGKPELFDAKTIKMPKMVVKNAPTINPWYGMKH